MPERKEKTDKGFNPSITLERLFLEFQNSHDVDLEQVASGSSIIMAMNPLKREQRLKREFKKTQNNNQDWIEERFRELRVLRREWSLDGMWVNEDGEQVGNALWSSYDAFISNAQLQFSYSYLSQRLQDLSIDDLKSPGLVFPLKPKFDSTLFWHEKDDEVVRAMLDGKLNEYGVDNYSQYSRVAQNVQMARIRSGKLGVGQATKEGIAFGQIWFWDSPSLGLGQGGPGRYVPRVRFEATDILPKGANYSPLDPDEVKERGGNTMEEKHPGIPMVRLDSQAAEEDFIAAAVNAPSIKEGLPVVLRYRTPDILEGEGPRHGGW